MLARSEDLVCAYPGLKRSPGDTRWLREDDSYALSTALAANSMPTLSVESSSLTCQRCTAPCTRLATKSHLPKLENVAPSSVSARAKARACQHLAVVAGCSLGDLSRKFSSGSFRWGSVELLKGNIAHNDPICLRWHQTFTSLSVPETSLILRSRNMMLHKR
jgi:hypothetical protein